MIPVVLGLAFRDDLDRRQRYTWRMIRNMSAEASRQGAGLAVWGAPWDAFVEIRPELPPGTVLIVSSEGVS